MLGPLRTLISVAFLAVFLWAAFTVKLGSLTFADHVDRIGQTEEAKQLLDGARSRVRPTLEEVKQRVLGEYVEAPTQPSSQPPQASPRASDRPTERSSPRPARVPAAPPRAVTDDPTHATRAERVASTPDAARLPGRRKQP